MWNLIQMEFNTLQLYKKKYLLIMGIVPFLAFGFLDWVDIDESYIVLNLLFAFLISIYVIGDEKPKSHYLINSLPIDKSHIIAGKYIFIHLSFLFSLIYLGIYLIVLNLFGFITFDNLNFQYLQTAILLMVMIINALAILMNNHGLFMRVIYFMLFNMGLRFLTDFEVINRLSKYKMYILILSILSIAISLALSIYLYNKREFARR